MLHARSARTKGPINSSFFLLSGFRGSSWFIDFDGFVGFCGIFYVSFFVKILNFFLIQNCTNLKFCLDSNFV
jgi:hypothetical protein